MMPKRDNRRAVENPQRFHNGCVGKIKYSSKRRAIAGRMRIIRSAPTRTDWEDAVRLEVYKCAGHYHLGHGKGCGRFIPHTDVTLLEQIAAAMRDRLGRENAMGGMA